jgi:hypothetical protein
MTNDIDIVVDLRAEQLDPLLQFFPQEAFYFDRDAALDAIKTRFQFNIIHRGSLAKVDMIILGGSSHDREQMRRVRRIRGTMDYDAVYCSSEDLILKKLQFHKESESEKHLRDVAGILKKSGNSLDMQYLENWTDWLNVLDSWRKAQRRARGERDG